MTFEDRVSETLRMPIAEELRAALDLRVRAAINAKPVQRRVLPIRRTLLFAALLALSLPGLLVGGMYLTESPLGLGTAREYAAEIEAAKLVVPLPDGRTWPRFLEPNANETYSRGGGQPTVESVAMCIWFDEWLVARAGSDAARERIAEETIASIPTWRSWYSPFFDESYRQHRTSIIAAVGRGDEAPVRSEMNSNCSWVAAGNR